MTPTHATKKAKRYRYYVSAPLLADDRPQAQKGMRVPAGDIEGLVLIRLRAFFSSRIDVGDAIAPLDLDARALDAAGIVMVMNDPDERDNIRPFR